MRRKKADLPGRTWGKLVRGLWALAVAASVQGVQGCGSDGEKQAPTPQMTRDVFGRTVNPAGSSETSGTTGWAIVLGSFSPDRESELGQPYEAAAHRALFRAQAMGGLSDVVLEKRGSGLVLLHGSFESATSGDAQKELAYVRGLNVGGERPYESAYLAPPGASTGTMPDYDLSTVRARRGTRSPLYTLQIAVYGRTDNEDPSKDDLEKFRAAAEEAVSKLRQEGEQAYYYHGPNRSMVTIGVYTEQDAGFTGRMRGESAALVVARQKYPNNLLNGEAVRERHLGEEKGKLQPSRLVEIPT